MNQKELTTTIIIISNNIEKTFGLHDFQKKIQRFN